MSSLVEAAKEGRRALLEAARDKLARDLDEGETPPYKVGEALRDLIAISQELDGVVAEEEGDDIGEAAATPDEPFSPY